jgi:hypothetical protein
MHRELIAEILIKFAITALVVMGTSSKIDATFHVVQAGLLPGWSLPQAVFPVNDFAPGAGRSFTLLLGSPGGAGRTTQGPIKLASLTVIVDFTILAPNHSGLLPDARVLAFAIFIFQAC